MPIRVISGLIGTFFLLQGVNWLLVPASAAQALGMPLLEGIARSTQIGDLSSFFLCLGGFAIYGAYRQNPNYLRAAGCLLGVTALTRTVAWAAHGAAFTTTFIVIELIFGVGLFVLASRIGTPEVQ